MARPRPGEIRLNRAAVAKVLKSPKVAAMTNKAAARVARSSGGRLDSYTTDRRAASVSVPAAEQARDGKLTRGAAVTGLTVKAKR